MMQAYRREGKIYYALYEEATDRSHKDTPTVVYMDPSDGSVHTRAADDFYSKYTIIPGKRKIIIMEQLPSGEILEFR